MFLIEVIFLIFIHIISCPPKQEINILGHEVESAVDQENNLLLTESDNNLDIFPPKRLKIDHNTPEIKSKSLNQQGISTMASNTGQSSRTHVLSDLSGASVENNDMLSGIVEKPSIKQFHTFIFKYNLIIWRRFMVMNGFKIELLIGTLLKYVTVFGHGAFYIHTFLNSESESTNEQRLRFTDLYNKIKRIHTDSLTEKELSGYITLHIDDITLDIGVLSFTLNPNVAINSLKSLKEEDSQLFEIIFSRTIPAYLSPEMIHIATTDYLITMILNFCNSCFDKEYCQVAEEIFMKDSSTHEIMEDSIARKAEFTMFRMTYAFLGRVNNMRGSEITGERLDQEIHKQDLSLDAKDELEKTKLRVTKSNEVFRDFQRPLALVNSDSSSRLRRSISSN